MILAPMQGLTEVLFRKCYETCFPGIIDKAVSPFLSLTHGNLADAWKKIDDVLPENNIGSIPVVPQILGKEGDEFTQLANRLGEIGYDEVNWNIGCPMRRVAGKHRGSGILPYPDEIRQVLDTVVPKLQHISLSIKMRLGYVSADEIFKIIPILNDYPLKNVTIHPRTGKQQYSGSIDLNTFDQAIRLLKHPSIYNGDICSPEHYQYIRNRFTQLNDVMIGRGVLYDPTLPLKIKQIPCSVSDTVRFIKTLIEAILAQPVSDEGKQRKIKEYWCLLWHSTGITEIESKKVLHTPTLNDACQTIEKILLSLQNQL